MLAAHDVAAPLLFELERDEVLSRLAVRGLSRPALSELSEAVIEGPASRPLVDWVCERSRGNPLFAIGVCVDCGRAVGPLTAMRDRPARPLPATPTPQDSGSPAVHRPPSTSG